MNTLAHILAVVAALRLSLYAYDTLGDTTAGFLGLGLFALWLVLTFLAAHDDWVMFTGGGDDED